MRPGLLVAALLLGACRQQSVAPAALAPGDRLEHAALAAGILPDAEAGPVGLYGRETDRVCVVAAGEAYRVGALVDYGDGQGCSASGTASRSGEAMTIDFGACRVAARYDGDRIHFPAVLPGACDALCTGRASLAALDGERLSDTTAEASALHDAKGRALCAN